MKPAIIINPNKCKGLGYGTLHLQTKASSKKCWNRVAGFGDFGTWCGPCKMIAPLWTFSQGIRGKDEDRKVDVDNNFKIPTQ